MLIPFTDSNLLLAHTFFLARTFLLAHTVCLAHTFFMARTFFLARTFCWPIPFSWLVPFAGSYHFPGSYLFAGSYRLLGSYLCNRRSTKSLVRVSQPIFRTFLTFNQHFERNADSNWLMLMVLHNWIELYYVNF